MGDDVVYIRLVADWWPELILEGQVFLLLKSICDAYAYLNMDREDWIFGSEQRKTNFMKRKGQ